MGTYGGGLALFNPQKDQFTSFNPITSSDDEPLYLSVWSITQQKDNHLWIGTLGNGLFSFDIETRKFLSLQDIYPELDHVMNDYILSLMVDSNKNLWIGTSNGIYVWYKDSKKYKRWLFDNDNNSGVGKNAICENRT